MLAFSDGVAYGDIVLVENEDGILFFDGIVGSSGHSVLHVVVFKPEESSRFIQALASLGVVINFLHNDEYLVIDVPPYVDYMQLRKLLLIQLQLNTISVREAKVSEVHFKMIAEELG